MLPKPPTAAELDLTWLMENKVTLAAYMGAIYALANGRVRVTYEGRQLPARAIEFGPNSVIIDVVVS